MTGDVVLRRRRKFSFLNSCLLSSHFKFLDEFHILFTERYSGFLNCTRDLSTISHRDKNLRFDITEPTELLIYISLVTLATFPLSKHIYLLYITKGVADGGSGVLTPALLKTGSVDPPDSRMKWPKSDVFFDF